MKPHGFGVSCLATALATALLSIAPLSALGAGFALQEQNGSGLGNAYAGGAAVAEDASTIYFNPAGMSRLPGIQGVAAGNLICPSNKFHDNGSQPAALQPLGGTGGDAGSCAFPPAFLSGSRPNTTRTGWAASRRSSPNWRRPTSTRRCRTNFRT